VVANTVKITLNFTLNQLNPIYVISVFHRAFFNSIMNKTPTHALFTQLYISLVC